MFRPFILALIVAVVGVGLYARTLTADFVWDARAKVLISGFIHDRGNLPDLLTGRVLTRDVLDNNRPGMLLSLMGDSVLWGKRPAGYHATSVVLHGAVCGMLFLLLMRLLPEGGDGRVAAMLAALAFAVHPLNCEPVSEVSYREDLLVAASILVALFAAMAFLRRPGVWRNVGLGMACCVALLYGVEAKENGVAGPVVLAAYWLLWRRGERRLPWVGLVGCAWGVVGVFLVARFTLRPEHSMIFTMTPSRLGGSLWGTLLIQVRIWAMGFSQVIVPHDLCADYGGYSIRNYPVTGSAAAVMLVVAGMVWLGLRDRVFALGAVWFWAGLLPVSNFVPLFRPMADRFYYVPLMGVALMVAQGLYLLRGVRPAVRVGIHVCAGVAIVAGGVFSFRREAVWHDEVSLWEDTVAGNPASETAANNLGWALIAADRDREALSPLKRAVELSHGADPDPWAGAAIAGEGIGRSDIADAAFKRAASIDPRYGHPDELVRALTMEEKNAAKLRPIAERNATR